MSRHEEYIVLGGANMVLRGIKPRTHDLDILVSDSLLANLSNRKGAVIKRPPLRARLQGAINDTVWLNTTETDIPVSATNSLGDGYYPLSFQTHKDQVELVDGIPLADVIGSKEALQRPRDVSDLEAIAEFMGTTLVLPEPKFVGQFLES